MTLLHSQKDELGVKFYVTIFISLFNDRINSEHYDSNIQTLVATLSAVKLPKARFQQDNANC
jgi:hypothetical protein